MPANNKHDSMTAPRYAEIATFMRAPFVADFQQLDIALVGVPYDGGTSNRPGARHGPREIRNASTMMRSTHHVTRMNPHELCVVGDVGDVPFTEAYNPEGAMVDIEHFYRQLSRAGVMPLTAGGDHSITYPILKVLGSERPAGLIHIDAHTDTWDMFQGSRFSHGAPFPFPAPAADNS